MLEGIYVGIQIVLIKPFDFMQNPLNWARAITHYKASYICGPNFAYELLTERLSKLINRDYEGISFDSIKRVISGAEPIKVNTILKFLKVASEFGLKDKVFMPAYGLAEGTLLVTTCDFGQESRWLKINRKMLFGQELKILERGRLSDITNYINEYSEDETFLLGNGTITNEHELLIIDPNNKRILNNLEIGEICIIGPSVTKGYWHSNREIDESYIYDDHLKQRYLRTGDLGFRDVTGELYVLSRLKDLIIIDNLIYFPQDIERVACSSVSELEKDGTAAFVVKVNNKEKLVIVQEVAWSVNNGQSGSSAIIRFYLVS